MISCEKTYDSLGFAFTISIFDHIGRTQDIRYVCFHSRYAHVLHVGHSFENGSHSHRFVYYMPRSNWHASSQESCSWTAVTWIQRQTFAASSGLTGKHQHGPHVCAKTLAIHLPLDGFCKFSYKCTIQPPNGLFREVTMDLDQGTLRSSGHAC